MRRSSQTLILPLYELSVLMAGDVEDAGPVLTLPLQ